MGAHSAGEHGPGGLDVMPAADDLEATYADRAGTDRVAPAAAAHDAQAKAANEPGLHSHGQLERARGKHAAPVAPGAPGAPVEPADAHVEQLRQRVVDAAEHRPDPPAPGPVIDDVHLNAVAGGGTPDLRAPEAGGLRRGDAPPDALKTTAEVQGGPAVGIGAYNPEAAAATSRRTESTGAEPAPAPERGAANALTGVAPLPDVPEDHAPTAPNGLGQVAAAGRHKHLEGVGEMRTDIIGAVAPDRSEESSGRHRAMPAWRRILNRLRGR